jgi:hypothetical protein
VLISADVPLSSSAPSADERFAQLLAQAEQLHRSGRQRFALLAIDQLAQLVGEAGPSLDALFDAICLRKRVVLAMSER